VAAPLTDPYGRHQRRSVRPEADSGKSYIEREAGPSLIAASRGRGTKPTAVIARDRYRAEREGSVTAKGKRYSASAVRSMLKSG
jgi:hypothetical protein